MGQERPALFEFEGYRLDPGRRLLLGPDGARIPLKPKVMSTLVCLVEHADELLDKQMLMREVWGQRIVEENSLNHHISTLRHVLGEHPGENRFIVTVPGVGYRFVAKVHRVGCGTGGGAQPDRSGHAWDAAAGLARRAVSWRAAGGASRRKTLAVVATLLVGAVILAGAFGVGMRGADERWARQEAFPSLERLIEAGDWEAAFALAERVEARMGESASTAEFWPRMSWLVDIASEPPGATVFRRSYAAVDDEWIELGKTPLESIRIPFGLSLVKLELDGHLPHLRTLGGGLLRPKLENLADVSSDIVVGSDTYRLETKATLPEGKVRVPGWSESIGAVPTEFQSFFLDRYEVTNAQFKVFVDAGGYERPELWEPFVRDGVPVSWEKGIRELIDRTGMPGPSTWAHGRFPRGQGNHPVAGVSWYEAAAYARFMGQELPTAYHWRRGRAGAEAAWVLAKSNVDGDSPRPVGESRAMSYVGAYDLAGNVREWTATAQGGERIIAGGSWQDEPYVAVQPLIATAPAFDRSPGNGFRLAITADEADVRARAATPFEAAPPPSHRRPPISDETYSTYGELFAYDNAPLNAVVETEERTRLWTRQRISFDAAYGDERMILYLYVPSLQSAPYQTVIYWPTSAAYLLKSIDDYQNYLDFIVRNGRAVAFPVYAGTFERANNRGPPFAPTGPVAYRDNLIEGVNDLRRSIDYLQTRADIDSTAFAFFGHSQGGVNAPIVLTREPRLRAGIVYVGFLPPAELEPLADPAHALARVDVPVLLLSGEFDSTAPVEMARRYFELIGTAEPHKKHVVAPGSHFVPRDVLIRETLDWLDTYLGPVRRP